MPRALLWGSLILILSSQIVESKFNTSNLSISFSAKSDRSWLWGWAWGAESTVSVVDRSPIVSFLSRPAAFGAEIQEPILGYVIPLSSFTIPCPSNDSSLLPDNTGCPELCLNGPNQPTEAWIALVQRGKCEFVKKVREAQKLGARAVVVGGDNPELSGYPDALVNMYSPEDSSDVKIASTYIKYSDYIHLTSLIDSSNTSHSGLRTLSLLITAEYSAWEWYSPIITFVIILLLPSALTFITLLIHRIRASRAAQRDRAPEDVVRNLPWHIWTGQGWEKHEGAEHVQSSDSQLEAGLVPSDSERVDEDSSHPSTSHNPEEPAKRPWFETQLECAICLSEFEKGDKVRELPCHHIFHLEEVDEWLIQRRKLCPVCKSDVTQLPSPPAQHMPQALVSSPTDTQAQVQPQPTTSSPSPHTPTERTPLLGNRNPGDTL